MRSVDRRVTVRRVWARAQREAAVLVIFCVLIASCGSDSLTAPPTDGGRSYVGIWSGQLVSAAIGAGTLVLSLTSQIETTTSPLVRGTWTLTFPDRRFDSTGTVIGAVGPGGTFGVTFDRSTVPCPQEAGGIARQTMFASLTVEGVRMRGSYIAGACPGGTVTLTKQ